MKTKGEKTKQHIIDVAADLFWKNSYQGVNTNTISDGAGVNKATIYRYFPSKDALALAVIENYCDRTLNYIFKGSFDATEDPIERLEEIFHRVYQTHLHVFAEDGTCPGCPFVNISIEMATANPAMRTAIDQCFTKFGAYYRKIIQDAKRLEICSLEVDEDLATNSLISVMNGALVASKIKNDPVEIINMASIAQLILCQI